jgi:hypothetical protein
MAIAQPGQVAIVPRKSHPSRAATARYLDRWARLDPALTLRLGGDHVVCFGIGEASSLLRAYAPAAWQRVRMCTADEMDGVTAHADRPVVPLDTVPPTSTILLGVRPQDQAAVRTRLSRRFARVVSWSDLVLEERV